jgi:hypothetical protein
MLYEIRNETVTKPLQNRNETVTPETETETETETDPETAREEKTIPPEIEKSAFALYGSVPTVHLLDWLGKWPPEWIKAAMLATEGRGKKYPTYTEGILRDYQKNGGPDHGRGNGDQRTSQASARNSGVLSREPEGKFDGRD